MADVSGKDPGKALEEEVWVAISAFEQILEAMPNDRASLEALSHAYGQIGDHSREKEYIIRLGNVLVEEGDERGAMELLPKVEPYVAEDARALQLVDRIRNARERKSSLLAGVAAAVGTSARGVEKGPGRGGFSMADELSFAWNLLQAEQLSQDEYARVVHDLTEMTASDAVTTISVLHVLEFKASKNLERSIAFVVRDCGTPFVTLSSFSFPIEAMSVLPIDFMVRRGVLVFDFIGQDALVAIMNPYNTTLREEVEVLTSRKCHFFVALPSDFDQALGRVRAFQEDKASSSGSDDK
jgi:hypothetical protein